MSIRKTILLGLLLALIGPGAIPFAEAEGPCLPTLAGSGTCTFAPGDAEGGTYVYDTIIVPPGTSVRALSTIVLRASIHVFVHGDLAGADATSTTAPGASIQIDSQRDVTITGTVAAGNGSDAADHETNVPGSVGDMGGNGGNVYLSTGPLGTLTLAHGSVVRAGDGGAGGDMRVILTPASTAAATIEATGGTGGQGGSVTTNAFASAIEGTVIVGSGGRGGKAFALNEPGTLDAFDNALVHAIGGQGGASGTANLPAGADSLTLANLGLLRGGKGGDGGDALAFADATPSGDSAVRDDTPRMKASSYCGGKSGGYAEAGRSGCQGIASRADGARGTDGFLYGGKGGAASSWSGTGYVGGEGGDGWIGNCYYLGFYSSSCFDRNGGAGGRGGASGLASAYGGQGGNALIEGGSGGNAAAHSGNGGTGGKGGKGGYGVVFNWDDTWDEEAIQALLCYAVFGDLSEYAVIGCVIVTPGMTDICAAAGHAGFEGTSIYPEAHGGAGGKNLNGLGLAASSGTSAKTPGHAGSYGQHGDPPYWPKIWPDTKIVYDGCFGYNPW